MAFNEEHWGKPWKNRVFTENSVRYCDEIVDKREIDYDGCNCWQDPHVLVIMDGVGHREAIEDNAFLAAKPRI